MSAPSEGWAGGELALQTVMVAHVEQIVPGSAAVACGVDGCERDAVLYIASEPDLDPGPVCAEHGHSWLDLTMRVLRDLFPPP